MVRMLLYTGFFWYIYVHGVFMEKNHSLHIRMANTTRALLARSPAPLSTSRVAPLYPPKKDRINEIK